MKKFDCENIKFDCVLTAVNENPLYIGFVPLFIKTWKKLYPDIDVKVVLIANNMPSNLIEYEKNIILYEPIQNVSTSFISQYIRLLYPCILEYKGGVMISDIDIMPMNRSYYTENIKKYGNEKFIYFRENICSEHNEIAMCYNIATPLIWRDIFKINSLNDVTNRLIKIYSDIRYEDGHGKSGWSTDQIHLCKYVTEWNKKTNNFIRLKENETKFKRLDRSNIVSVNHELTDEVKKNIKNQTYTDYHCLRPMEKYEKINNDIYNLL